MLQGRPGSIISGALIHLHAFREADPWKLESWKNGAMFMSFDGTRDIFFIRLRLEAQNLIFSGYFIVFLGCVLAGLPIPRKTYG
ncbi:hypothetical protein BDZ94DRAFT_1253599 [Collybia nuda]|uniref:Uncharacterized protein n=1 Tax=Collybia nuda TaxID=64659 RepID=A0A9P5Y8R6_9AGAR|nr:hypothetical protein BDZ94DRAFT_1253599 [Collybia nuda]